MLNLNIITAKRPNGETIHSALVESISVVLHDFMDCREYELGNIAEFLADDLIHTILDLDLDHEDFHVERSAYEDHDLMILNSED